MKIKVRHVTTIPVLWIEEDNYYEFAWIKGINDYHVAVF